MDRKKLCKPLLTILTHTSIYSALQAQVVTMTFNHDESKMNQVTVMETGAGSLTPSLFYEGVHGKYSEDASKRNKLARRNEAGVAAYTQKDMAESVDSAMARQGRVEALNIADRSGGVLDAAWNAEGGRLTAKMESFKRNIDRLAEAGATAQERSVWTEQYDMFVYAIETVQQAYMPNAERKKSYLDIYRDVSSKNESLVRFLVQVQRRSSTSRLLNAASVERNRDNSGSAGNAMDRWKRSSGQNDEHTLEK